MAIPQDEDLFVWEKYSGNPVLTQATHISGPIAQWRDPFLFQTYASNISLDDKGRTLLWLWGRTNTPLCALIPGAC